MIQTFVSDVSNFPAFFLPTCSIDSLLNVAGIAKHRGDRCGVGLVWYPASLCVRKVDVWHNRKGPRPVIVFP